MKLNPIPWIATQEQRNPVRVQLKADTLIGALDDE
jgi:hypothetical protein